MTSSAERSTTVEPPIVEGVPSYLQIGEIDALRERQEAALSEVLKSRDDWNDITADEEAAIYAQAIKTHLGEAGLEDGSEEYEKAKKFLETVSVNTVNDKQWLESKSEAGTHTPSRRDITLQYLIENAETSTDDDEDAQETDEESGESEAQDDERERAERLEQLKKAKQEAYVKKIKTGRFSPNRKRNMEAYEAAEAAYAGALQEDIRLRLDEQLGDDLNPDQRAQIIKELAEEQIHSDEAEQHQLLLERGGRRARFLARYEKWSTKKKIGVGLLMATGGAAAGFAAGLAGAGVAVIGAGMAGYRFGRAAYLAKSRIYREPSSEVGFSYDASSDVAAEEQIVRHMNGRARNRIEAADKARERAVYVGIGTAAVGGSIAGAAGLAGAFFHASNVSVGEYDIGLNDGHWRGGYIEHFTGDDVHATVEVSDTDTAGEGEPDGGGDLSGGVGPAPDTVVDESLENLSDAAQTIRVGEGWYETFADHGIDSAHHAELLKEVGPELDAKYPDLAYFDKSAGEWRIGYSGELPKGASEIILNAAHEHGWLDGATDAAHETAESVADEPFMVEHGHGYTHELMQAAEANGVETTPEQAWEAHQTIVDENGPDYIDQVEGSTDSSGPDVYSMGDSEYDTGISAPVEHTWGPEARDMVNDFADDGEINGSYEAPSGDGDASAAIDNALEPDPDGVIPDETIVYDDAGTPEVDVTLGDVRGALNAGDLAQLEAKLPDEIFQDMAKNLSGLTYGDAADTHVFEYTGGMLGEYRLVDAPEGVTLPDSVKIAINNYFQETYVTAA